MAHWSAAFLALPGRALRTGGGWLAAAFKLSAMQGLELRLELLVASLGVLVLAPFLIQFLPEFPELIFVLAGVTHVLLIPAEDPAGGQALQIRAAVPVGAAEIGRQVSELRHA